MSDILTTDNIDTAKNVLRALIDHPSFGRWVSGHGFEDTQKVRDLITDLEDLPDLLAVLEEEGNEKFKVIAKKFVGDFLWNTSTLTDRETAVGNVKKIVGLWEAETA